ncbi:MAG: TGS domain-containing protein [Candidatus Aminicenantes bacterium]|nr:TGS domain-containing protein [Candidatus Aminicenantes bacterium]
MPANLPPQYFEKEKELKTAKTAGEKITIMEELLSLIPKHKGTEKLQALYKTKISKLRSQSQKKAALSRHGPTFHVDKAGAGQVILTGLPNSGKSSLIKALTNANPDIGDYPFTTHAPSPAMMMFENIQIQLIDTPPITPEYFEPWHAELIKSADAVLLLMDLGSQDPVTDLNEITEKLKEKNIELVPEDQDISPEKQFFLKRTLVIANKTDLPGSEVSLSVLRSTIDPVYNLITISALEETELKELKKRIFAILKVVRVYSKMPGKKVEKRDPYVFRVGDTLMDMAKTVHKDFSQKLKFARIWGQGKYQGQKVNQEYVLQDEDIIELHI